MMDSILHMLENMIWSDTLKMIFEVFILTLIIYKLLYYLRGARGSSVLAGVIILLIGMGLLSSHFHLDVISWLMDKLLATFGVAMVIIFQPELRRAFAQLGSFSFFQGRRRREVISELVAAAGNMGKRKCGALIVVERRIGLQNLVDDAVKLDIKVNAMVLESIFFPNSPLHDGAIIIRNDRIVAARAILPLSRDENLSRTMGTRHRAALGVTEENDCVVVIVSEETGDISVAYQGAIQRELSRQELTKRLHELLLRSNTGESRAEEPFDEDANPEER